MSPAASVVDPPDSRRFCQLLLDWYDEHARVLPWRGAAVTPYETLVSEVMLQQTRVETVKPKYAAFLTRFPTVESLAMAPLDDVLALWSGLGYYSRARNLHAAAQQLVDLGGFPNDVAGLLKLKGVGTYIAGAVGSIALGLPEPAVDGNLERVLARLVRSPGGRREMTHIARALILGCPERAGDINQALMDLGSGVCKPTHASCLQCPLQPICAASTAEDPTAWPERKSRRKAPIRVAVAGVCTDPHGRILVARRPPAGLFGGLYELPGQLLEAGITRLPRVNPITSAWQERLGVTPSVTGSLGTVTHTLTHMRLTLHVFAVASPSCTVPRAFYDGLQWLHPLDIDARGISTLTRKALGLLQAGPQPSLFTERPSQ